MSGAIDRLLFPPLCRHCGTPFRKGLSNILCAECFEGIESDRDPRCLLCGKPLSPAGYEGSVDPRCADCRERESPLSTVRCFAPYEGALRQAHHSFKFEGMPSLAVELGRCLAKVVLSSWLEGKTTLVPVPLSSDRERERGYHPARLLACDVSARTGLPVAEPVEKVRATAPQMSLPREERLGNLKAAFAVRKGVRVPVDVVLVDDVMTTGSTLEGCAEVLAAAGTRSVSALVLGRTARIVE